LVCLYCLSAQGQVTFSGSVRSRIESWDWFTADNGDHAYTFDGSTIRFGVSQVRTKFDWNLELEAPDGHLAFLELNYRF
jgi:hypothetical protein